jgi:hypothetical protein
MHPAETRLLDMFFKAISNHPLHGIAYLKCVDEFNLDQNYLKSSAPPPFFSFHTIPIRDLAQINDGETCGRTGSAFISFALQA